MSVIPLTQLRLFSWYFTHVMLHVLAIMRSSVFVFEISVLFTHGYMILLPLKTLVLSHFSELKIRTRLKLKMLFYYSSEVLKTSDWRHSDVLKFNTRIIKQFSSNTSCFVVCEATCFGPYMTIIKPSYESS